MPLFAEELEFTKSLVQDAAVFARQQSPSLKAHEKQNQSYVTDLDLELERLLRERIAARFPDDRLTGEEYSAGGGGGPRWWSIDPIDGTGNLVHGLPLWAISVGLIDAGEPVLGVIAIPPLGELYWGTRDGGAWRDGERLASRDADGFHNQDNVCVGTNALRAVDPRTLPGRLRDLGSACCELAFLACNRLQACTFLGEQAHDVAAGSVIAAEAGCAIATIDGRMLSPAEFVADVPVRVPTIVAPPKRLGVLLARARRL
jgi:myo-inositol-1(or 4)-monophosphatase